MSADEPVDFTRWCAENPDAVAHARRADRAARLASRRRRAALRREREAGAGPDVGPEVDAGEDTSDGGPGDGPPPKRGA